MGLAAIFMNTSAKAVDATAKQASHTESSDMSFDSYMDDINKKESIEKPVDKPQHVKRQKNSDKRSNNEKPIDVKSNETETEKPEAKPVDTNKTKVTAAQTTSTEKPVQQDVKELSDTDAKLINDLSLLMNMPVDAILEILASLNMTPTDLTDSNNLNLFMQNVFAVSSPIELLEMPQIDQIYQNVSKLLESYKPQTENETATELIDSQISTTPQTSQAVTQQHGEAHVQEAAQNLNNTTQAQEVAAKITEPDQNVLQETSDTPSEVVQTETRMPNIMQKDTTTSNNEGNPQNAQTDIDQRFVTELLNNNPTVQENVRFDRLDIKDEAAKTINTQDVINQIVEKLKVDVRDNIQEVRITLKPEHLGDVSLKISTQNGIVTAQFVAENQRIKEIIESNASHLRDTLKEQGISLSSISVSVAQDEHKERMDSFLRSQQDQSRRIRRINGLNLTEANAVEEVVYADPMDMMDYTVNYTA